jgi:NADH-quinone oxidoreductase subunit C
MAGRILLHMTPKAICDLLGQRQHFTPRWNEGPGDPCAFVPADRWRSCCQLLKQDPDLSFDFMRSLTAVDRPLTGLLEVVVHLFSYKQRHSFVLKTEVDRHEAKLESLQELWPAAIWLEREVYDLFGVTFAGHPDLRRLVLPEDWAGHPLRKDYQEQDSYHGIPTRRSVSHSPREKA